MVHRKELNIPDEDYWDIAEIELPKMTGRLKKRNIRPLSHEQIFKLERVLSDEKSKLMLLISYFSGLRLGELLKIDLLSFNWEEWKKDITKMGECRVYGKGDKEGIALIPPHIMVRIAKYIRSKKWPVANAKLFITTNGKVNYKNKARNWQMILRKAGIDSHISKLDTEGKPLLGEAVHPHRLRHSYGNHLLKDKKVDIRYIKEALRHSSIQSTQIYTQVDTEDLKEKLKD